MLSEVLMIIEVKLSEEQDKIAQTVTGSNGAQMKPTTYDEYVNASKAKTQKGKGNGKGTSKNWRQPCADYWEPDSCSLGHNCPKHHPRRKSGRCAFCGSTKHYTSQRKRPIKPKSKNIEHDEDQSWNAPTDTRDNQRQDHTRKPRRMRLLKVRKSKVRDPS